MDSNFLQFMQFLNTDIFLLKFTLIFLSVEYQRLRIFFCIKRQQSVECSTMLKHQVSNDHTVNLHSPLIILLFAFFEIQSLTVGIRMCLERRIPYLNNLTRNLDPTYAIIFSVSFSVNWICIYETSFGNYYMIRIPFSRPTCYYYIPRSSRKPVNMELYSFLMMHRSPGRIDYIDY